MIEKDILFEILRDQNYWFKPTEFTYIERKEYLITLKKSLDVKSILVIQGPRRAGKTVIIKLLIEDLMKTVEKNKILYLNLEDYRLYPYYSIELLDAVYKIYRENINPKGPTFFFIDEIQNVLGFEHYLRTKYDSDDQIKFIITGSNSKLLSKELASLLTGRTLTTEIFPFSFKEYLSYKKERIPEKPSYYSLEPIKLNLKHLFNEYSLNSALPEFFEIKSKERLEEYFNNVILKDIVERFKVRNSKLIKDLGIFLLSNAGNLVSQNSLANTFQVSINTIKEYLSYLETAYLFFTLNPFSYSYKKHVTRPSKIYCVDNGLINLVSFKFSENKGRLYENLVFLELKREREEIYYYSLDGECDFVIIKNLKLMSAIQVSVKFYDERTKKREFDALISVLKEHELKEGLILTEDEYKDVDVNGFKIKVRPLWFWLINKKE